MNEIKTIWRERWLNSINELTSLNLQKQSWLDKSHKNPHWSFVEFMCCYFDDLTLKDNYEYALKEGFVTRQEFEIIEPWHINLDNYQSPNNDDYDNCAILNDPEWLKIIATGVTAKSKLIEILSESEQKRLTVEINYKEYI